MLFAILFELFINKKSKSTSIKSSAGWPICWLDDWWLRWHDDEDDEEDEELEWSIESFDVELLLTEFILLLFKLEGVEEEPTDKLVWTL